MACKTLQLQIVVPLEQPQRTVEKNEIYELLRELRHGVFLASNNLLTLIYMNTMNRIIKSSAGEELPPEKDIYGKSFRTVMYDCTKEFVPKMSSACVSQVVANVSAHFSYKKKEVIRGQESLSNYKYTIPIPFPAKACELFEKDGEWFVLMSLLNKSAKDELNLDRILFKLVKPKKYATAILDGFLSGQYEMGAGSILEKGDGTKKWYINLSYKHQDAVAKETGNVMGLSVGAYDPVAYSIFDTEKGEILPFFYRRALIDEQEFLHVKSYEYKRRKYFSSATKFNKSASSGHGYDRRLEKVNRFSKRIENYKKSINHKYSAYIVNEAVANEVNVIYVPDSKSTNFGKVIINEKFPVADLVTKLKYKAAEQGIEVIELSVPNIHLFCNKCHQFCLVENENDPHTMRCPVCGEVYNTAMNISRVMADPDVVSYFEKEEKSPKKKKSSKKVVETAE